MTDLKQPQSRRTDHSPLGPTERVTQGIGSWRIWARYPLIGGLILVVVFLAFFYLKARVEKRGELDEESSRKGAIVESPFVVPRPTEVGPATSQTSSASPIQVRDSVIGTRPREDYEERDEKALRPLHERPDWKETKVGVSTIMVMVYGVQPVDSSMIIDLVAQVTFLGDEASEIRGASGPWPGRVDIPKAKNCTMKTLQLSACPTVSCRPLESVSTMVINFKAVYAEGYDEQGKQRKTTKIDTITKFPRDGQSGCSFTRVDRKEHQTPVYAPGAEITREEILRYISEYIAKGEEPPSRYPIGTSYLCAFDINSVASVLLEYQIFVDIAFDKE